MIVKLPVPHLFGVGLFISAGRTLSSLIRCH